MTMMHAHGSVAWQVHMMTSTRVRAESVHGMHVQCSVATYCSCLMLDRWMCMEGDDSDTIDAVDYTAS
jgi:hypothetical protein